MNRKSGAYDYRTVLLDSTYLLPIFGVSVKEVGDDFYLKLRRLALSGRVEVYYSPVSFIEITSKVAKEAIKKKVVLRPEELRMIVNNIEKSEYLKPARPNPQVYALAYEMKLKGHKDIIDNILYATATVYGLSFITLDKTLRDFIKNNKIKGAKVLSHIDLLYMLT
ncbi:MAG: PIN domain-containing protein [Desulfurococcales archaeon]|nr:PIN domain-containing protein [Desulfurococcales archaeon]